MRWVPGREDDARLTLCAADQCAEENHPRKGRGRSRPGADIVFGRLRGKHQRFGRYTGKDLDERPFVGLSDQVLVDLKDHNLVNGGLFIA